MEDILKFKVYRNDTELVAAFKTLDDATSYIEQRRVMDDWKVCESGEVVYNTEG